MRVSTLNTQQVVIISLDNSEAIALRNLLNNSNTLVDPSESEEYAEAYTQKNEDAIGPLWKQLEVLNLEK